MAELKDPAAAHDSASEDPWREVRRAFQLYFQAWELALPSSLAAKGGVITGRGWQIHWRTSSLRGRSYLDFYASHRMTNERHHRIWQDGRLGDLPAALEFLCFPDGCTPAQEKVIRDRYAHRNGRIGHLIKAKFPEPPSATGVEV